LGKKDYIDSLPALNKIIIRQWYK